MAAGSPPTPALGSLGPEGDTNAFPVLEQSHINTQDGGPGGVCLVGGFGVRWLCIVGRGITVFMVISAFKVQSHRPAVPPTWCPPPEPLHPPARDRLAGRCTPPFLRQRFASWPITMPSPKWDQGAVEAPTPHPSLAAAASRHRHTLALMGLRCKATIPGPPGPPPAPVSDTRG